MILLTLLIVSVSIIIGIVLGNVLKENKKFIDLSIGLALGVMLLLIVTDILPEANELLSESIGNTSVFILVIGACIGLFILKLLDSFIPHHEHESLHHHRHRDNKCHDEHLEHVGVLASVAVIIHNIIEGMTLYVTLTQDFRAGVLLCVAVGLHNIPLGIVISSTLNNKKETIIHSIILSLSTFVGGLIVMLVSNIITSGLVGILLSITLGMVIYISMFELLPQVIHNKQKKYSVIGIILGVILIILSTMLG